MLSRFAKAVFVSTSFAPILITFAFVEWQDNGFSKLAIGLVASTALLVLVCIGVLKFATRRFEQLRFPIQSIEAADTESVGYIVAYILPLVNAGDPTVNTSLLIFVLVVFALVVWGSNAYHFNPLLGILQYNFYQVTTDAGVSFIMVTTDSVRKSADVDTVVQLSEYIVVAVEE